MTSHALVSFARELTKNVEPQTCGNYFSHLSNIFTVARPQGTQQHNLSPAQEQAVTHGLTDQPTQNMPSGFTGQVGSKLPSSETGKPLPSDVQAQVPEVKQMLFVKLRDRVLLIDPDSKAVAEILMAPATTGSSPGSSGSPAR